MLPVVAGEDETRKQILIYALILTPLAITPSFIGMASWFYGGCVAVAGAIFVAMSWRIWASKSNVLAMRLFAYSIVYLFFVFLGLVLDQFVAGLML